MLSDCAGCNLHCLPFFDRIGFDEVLCCVIKSTEMESIKEIFRIGFGPSSSHTMAPRKAAELFLRDFPDAARFEVTLFGSLAATGKGHLTDKAVIDVYGHSEG